MNNSTVRTARRALQSDWTPILYHAGKRNMKEYIHKMIKVLRLELVQPIPPRLVFSQLHDIVCTLQYGSANDIRDVFVAYHIVTRPLSRKGGLLMK